MKNISQNDEQAVTATSYSEKNKLINLKNYTPEVNERGELEIKTSRPQKLKVLPKGYIILIALLILGFVLPLFCL